MLLVEMIACKFGYTLIPDGLL